LRQPLNRQEPGPVAAPESTGWHLEAKLEELLACGVKLPRSIDQKIEADALYQYLDQQWPDQVRAIAFSHALAASWTPPLLFKGDDFVHTDVRSALAPV
jgi:hypothetical protein